MLKSQEHRLKMTMDQIEQKHEEFLKLHVENFQYEVTKLRDVAKECHLIFVEEVKRVQESVTLKMEELKSEMAKEVVKLELNYLSLPSKVDVLAEAVKNIVEYNSLFSNKFESKIETDSKLFNKLEEFSESLKESFLKLDMSQQTVVSPYLISQMIFSLEQNLKFELAP